MQRISRPRRRRIVAFGAVSSVALLALLGIVGGAAAAPATGRRQAGGAVIGPSTTNGRVRALTYNVAGLPEPLSGSEPSVNTPLISPRLNAYDLVLVQEDWIDPDPPVPPWDFHHDDLISQVTHPYRSTPATPPVGTDPRRPEALVADGLNRLSRYPFGSVTRRMWTGCFGGADTSDGGAGDCLALKGFSVARTEVDPGVEIDVYNVHGEAGGTELDEQLRADGYRQLAEFMAVHSAGRAVILGGDTNLHTDRPGAGAIWSEFLEATGLTDVCQAVDCGADDHEIDKFAFRSGGGVTIEALSHAFERDEFRRDDGEPLSDHDPLAVEFSWTHVSDGPSDPAAPRPAGPPAARGATPVAVAGRVSYTG